MSGLIGYAEVYGQDAADIFKQKTATVVAAASGGLKEETEGNHTSSVKTLLIAVGIMVAFRVFYELAIEG